MSYEEAIDGFRADKDEFFRSSPHSPVPEGSARVSPSYRITLLTRHYGSMTSFSSPTKAIIRRTSRSRRRTTGFVRSSRGTLRFDIDGDPYRLTAYTFDGGDGRSLFVPFLDTTSGRETYGAGRYLDLEPEDDGTYSLDFNLAYHPSCVYDPKFSCPLTPAENRLPIRIEAGERLPEA